MKLPNKRRFLQMRSKFFSIFKTLFAVVMLAVTITVFFVGCNPTDKKDTTDKGYTVPKETAEKQAIIDDWLQNKAVMVERLDASDYVPESTIFYNNNLYCPIELLRDSDLSDYEYYQRLNLLYSIKNKEIGENKLYAKILDRQQFMIYDEWYVVDESYNNYDKIRKFSYRAYSFPGYIAPICVLEYLFDRYFILEEDNVFRVKKEIETLAKFRLEEEAFVLSGFYDVKQTERNDFINYLLEGVNFDEWYKETLNNEIDIIKKSCESLQDPGYSIQFKYDSIVVESSYGSSGTLFNGRYKLTPIEVEITHVTMN